MKKTYFLFLIGWFFLNSCSSEASWQETDNHIKYWSPSQSIFDNYQWVGSNAYGFAHGEGYLTRVNGKGEIKSAEHYFATMGLLKAYDKITLNNSWKYWGEERHGVPHGLGVIERPDSALIIGKFKHGKSSQVNVILHDQLIYTGGWNHNTFNQYGTLINTDGQLLYQGHFKDGLFDGYGVLYINDSIIEHVWKKGKVQPRFMPIYTNLEQHRDQLSAEQYASFKSSLIHYERFGTWWKILIVTGVVLVIALMVVMYIQRRDKNYLFTREEPIHTGRLYLAWGLTGLWGVHRILLSSWTGFISIGLVAIAIFCNLTPLVLYAGHYSLIPVLAGWTPSFYIAVGCMGICAIWWVIDAVWVAWRIFYLTSLYYRHDAREISLLRGDETDVDILIKTIAKELPLILAKMQDAISKSREISSENIIHTTWIGRTLKHGEKDLEESKYNRIYKYVYEVKDLQHELKQYSVQLSNYLQEARINTYRNIYLTKEIIKYFKDKVKQQNQTVHHDQTIQIKDIAITPINAKEVEINVDAKKAIKTFNLTTTALSTAGMGTGACVGVGLVVATAFSALSYLEQQNRALEQYAKGVQSLIDNLNTVSSEAIKIEAQMIRMNELLQALYQCNIAYVKAYVKIRDLVFPEPTFMNFLRGINKRNAYFSSLEFKQDMIYLINVTSEYNKINTARINL